MKKITCFLSMILICAVNLPALQAQILPLNYTGTSPISFQVDANGQLASIGTYSTTATLDSNFTGAGTRMLWYPGKAAFRAGNVSGTDWNDTTIGRYSAAFGQDTTASGVNSFASGGISTASGMYSFAGGNSSVASGDYSFAYGNYASATGLFSIALGNTSMASGQGAISTGGFSIASGVRSFASGISTTASGYDSTSFGGTTQATSYLSFVIGQFNVGAVSTNGATTWVPTDPLFEIGNGSYTTKSDALIVYKNGNAVLQGTLQAAPGGDIPMYAGN